MVTGDAGQGPQESPPLTSGPGRRLRRCNFAALAGRAAAADVTKKMSESDTHTHTGDRAVVPCTRVAFVNYSLASVQTGILSGLINRTTGALLPGKSSTLFLDRDDVLLERRPCEINHHSSHQSTRSQLRGRRAAGRGSDLSK